MSDWQRIQSIFLASADLPVETRDSVLDELCLGDTGLRNEVESLLLADSESSVTIESAIQGVASTILDTPVLIGQRLGAYRIVREIGRGGMGAVYLALRDDDEYTKEVALKVVKRGMNTQEVLRRFRDERQILANLDHPYVARLFDGGTTVDGVSFFAMEYVEGRPVDVFCREQSLSVKARCELFLLILEAVAYAHRRLVVHGDLKPANIFVTSDGTPKLLDFGVAKLMGNEQGEVAAADTRVFTPGYASPEQVRGRSVTTSTDIYSLGSVLYELLSGKRAQPVDFDTPARIEYAVCDVDVLRPSLVARDLPADLDDVVLMALDKEPERRYQSAEQFADDIRRCLGGRPVIARENSVAYRSRKFIVRNRLMVAMAAVVGIALIGGLIVSLTQTRRARAERVVADSERGIAVRERLEAEEARVAESKQRDLAELQRRMAEEQRALALNERDDARSQKAIADQRFQQIMKLAEHTLFDVHDDIASLPGSMAARRKIIQTTLDYFESLQKTVGDNDDIRQALVAAYYKIALIQGSPRGASLQDSAGAEQTLRKAQAVLLPAYRRHPDDSGLILRWFEIRTLLADLIYRAGRPQEGIQMYVELIPLAHRLPTVKGCNLVCETQEPAIEIGVANMLNASDPEAALEHANRAIELNRALVARHPTDPVIKQALAVGLAVAASSYRDTGDLEKASEYFLKSIAVREELLRDIPGDMFISHNLMVAYGNYALLLGIPWSPNMGRPAEARLYAGKAAAIARGMLNAEPKDATAHRDLAVALGRLGMIDPEPGQTASSLALLQQAKDLVEPVAEANPKSFDLATQLALILHYQALRLEELGRMTEAEQAFRKSMALYEPFLNLPNLLMVSDYLADQDGLALLYASTGKDAAAVEMANKAIASAEKYAAMPPLNRNRIAVVASAWADLALVESKTGLPEPAHQNAEKAMQMWSTVKSPGILTAYRNSMSHARTILGIVP